MVDTIRGGLVGGRAFDSLSAELTEIVDRHVLKRPLAESVPLAKAVLMVALFGVPAALAADPVDVSAVADAAEGEAA